MWRQTWLPLMAAIDDLSGEIHQAKRDQAEQDRQAQQRDQAERERIERMSAVELAAEIERQRPPRALDLVERDQAVLKAEGERQALQNQHTEAGSASARDQAQAWREAHKVQAWLHDKGIGHAPELRELEKQRAAQHTEWQRLGPRVLDAEQRASSARDMARLRIQPEQSPALAKVAELEKLR
ncbi:MobA/MobL protein [Verminephrobacter eiseniae]|nr:MobA/MobL protein [Verminephrobacter eiseniae]MCW8179375.1 MobA/MobL protein [Verminephrobacter eiseniae]